MPSRDGLDDFLQRNAFFPDGPPSDWAIRNSSFNVFGYRSAVSDYRNLRLDQYVVGIFGGSVAGQLAVIGGDRLVTDLERRNPTLKGRVVLVNLTGGGYKQPQQINTLVEMIMLGVPFDLIINIDGLNEVAFGGTDAHFHGIHPIFPSYGHLRTTLEFGTGSMSNQKIREAAEILKLRKKVRSLANLGAIHPMLRRSAVARAFLGSLILDRERRIQRLEGEIQSIDREHPRSLPLPVIPDPCLGKPDACWRLIADLWRRASQSMDALSRGLGARYVHFLQPSQYVPGSKHLSSQERAGAFVASGPFGRGVLAGYPYLQRSGASLRARGISFYDLTGVFEEVDDTLYIDDCCHLNVDGYHLLAARIVADLFGDHE